MKYIAKPVIIEAVQFKKVDGVPNIKEIEKFAGCEVRARMGSDGVILEIDTIEGTKVASLNDYIIAGPVEGYYPCSPELFKLKYKELKEKK